MMPVYSSSAMGSMAGPKKPWRRMPMDLSATVSRTRFQNGCANASTGSVNRPSCMAKAAQVITGGAVEVADAGLERHRHQGHLMRATHSPSDVRADGEGRQHLAGGGEILLDPHQHHRVVLAGVLACNVMQARGGRHHRLLAAGERPHRFHHIALGVVQQRRNLVQFFRGRELNDPIAFRYG